MHDLKSTFDKLYPIVESSMKNYTNIRGNIKKSGSEPIFSDVNVITLSITAECLSIDSENLLFKKLMSEYIDDFPGLLERSRYNRRRRRLAGYIDSIVVSTDSDVIAAIASKFGAEVPFLRPKNLAEDGSSTNDVLIHAIKSLKEKFDILILLQPTSPLRTEHDIDDALKSFIDTDAETMVSVVEKGHPLEWSFRLTNLKLSSFFNEAKKKKRRQDYASSYELNGAIYISYVKEFVIHMSFLDVSGMR